MKSRTVFLILSFIGIGQGALAATSELRASAGETHFTAIGKPAMLKITGEGAGPAGSFSVENNKITGDLSVDLKSLHTGIDLRDDHMKSKYLQVGSYPQATLSLKGLELEKAPAEITGKIQGSKFRGTLTLHGVSKPVEGTFDVEPQGTALKVKAMYSMNLSDFNIEIPSYAGLKVADKVDVETTFSLLK